MKVKKEESALFKMRERLISLPSVVVLRKDFSDIGNYRVITDGLRKLVAEKRLVKISFGIYAKAYQSDFSEVVLVQGGVDFALRQALTRLGKHWEPGRAEIAYNEGKTTQVPVKNIVRLKARCRRRIVYKKSELVFEDNVNAK